MVARDRLVTAVALRYTRSTLAGRMFGGALKEALTLAGTVDLMLQGRIAEAADMTTQRLKAMERVAYGANA